MPEDGQQGDLDLEEGQPARNLNGWVKVYRLAEQHHHFRSRLDYYIFIDLVLRAQHETRNVMFMRQAITLRRGECAIRIRLMAKAWEMTPEQMRRRIDHLVREGCVKSAILTARQGLRVTICKYNEYQSRQGPSAAPPDAPLPHLRHTEQEAKKEKKDVRESLSVRQPPSSSKKTTAGEGPNGKLRAHELPEDWMPSEHLLDWALDKGYSFNLAAETEMFRNNFLGGGGVRKKSWDRTWMNWMMREAKDVARRKPRKNYQQQDTDDYTAALKRSERGEKT